MAAGIINGCVSSSSSSSSSRKKNGSRFRVCYASTSPLASDPLRIHRGASESQYHPDVCKENDGGIQFQQINEAYDMVMNDLRGETSVGEVDDGPLDETMRGMNDPDWELWEEWMGWEGAATFDKLKCVDDI
ncbi:uncharacterized protein LOC143623395 [Bidens hawaiensis]|uniref:uncharacterized protein LOC143623395 n=1 Tax=Bidens hawaiensis TaxID=980011 RepID=UPI00404B10DB